MECAEIWGRAFLADHAETCAMPSVSSSLSALPPTELPLPPSASELLSCPLPNYTPNTPIKIDLFASCLAEHPNRPLVDWAVASLRFGVRLGYRGERESRFSRNHGSAARNTQPLRDEIALGLASGRLVRLPHGHSPVWVSPLGVVPKPRSSSFRTIMDFSFPANDSINDRIFCETTQYDRIPSVLPWLRALGPSAHMAGVDVADAFRIIPVHAADLWLQASRMDGATYIDTSLIFGCRSSPAIFNAYASLFAWIIYARRNVYCILHYLDDFIVITPDFNSASSDYAALRATFSLLNIPLKQSKCYPPCQNPVHLGFQFDIRNQRISFTKERLISILDDIHFIP